MVRWRGGGLTQIHMKLPPLQDFITPIFHDDLILIFYAILLRTSITGTKLVLHLRLTLIEGDIDNIHIIIFR